eukprot:jgi/Chrpa1/4678/Chrysochromulina_OHIO_Genome00001508-RA
MNFHLPERYTPKNWMTNKFSAEMWLQHSMRTHPWRATSAADADLVLLEANFSMLCRAGKMFSGRFMWQKMNVALGMQPPKSSKSSKSGRPLPTAVSSTDVGDAAPAVHKYLRGAERVPKAYVLTDNECMPPWTGSKRMKGLIELTDQGPHENDVLAPFVLTKPWWLVGGTRGPSDAPAPAEVAWGQRRLLFFAGHVPKLYIAPTRYRIWQQVRRHPGVTAFSATLNCTIGSFSACRRVNNMTSIESRSYCADFCASHVMDDYKTFLNDAPGHVHAHPGIQTPVASTMARRRRSLGLNSSAGGLGTSPAHSISSISSMKTPPMGRCVSGILRLKKDCKHYKHVDFENELPDMAKSAINLPSHKYYEHAMGHRFCVAAPGDFVSTPKITEYVAMGAAGGCLPLLVIKGAPEKTLPYTRWLDWCSIAFIISDATARTSMASVLRKLELVSAEEAAAKRVALLAVRDAFVWRAPTLDPVAQPSAPDFLLGELCDAARSWRLNGSLSDSPVAGGPYARCMIN